MISGALLWIGQEVNIKLIVAFSVIGSQQAATTGTLWWICISCLTIVLPTLMMGSLIEQVSWYLLPTLMQASTMNQDKEA